MSKKSKLQSELMSIIDSHGGINELINNLNDYKINLNNMEKMMFGNFILFYHSLYRGYVNAEKDFINYRDSVDNHIKLLDECLAKNPKEYLYTLRKVVCRGRSWTDKMRLIV